MSDISESTQIIAREESTAISEILAGPDQCAYALVIVAHDSGNIVYSASSGGDTRLSHLEQFIHIVEKHLVYLKSQVPPASEQ